MSLPAAPAAGSNVVFFVATCAVIGIDNPMEILAYIMTIDWIMLIILIIFTFYLNF